MNRKESSEEHITVVARNRRALAKYSILESFEAGIVLQGPEVKSLRLGGANIQEGFVRIENDEAFLWNVHISPYTQGSSHVEQEPNRTRKLLFHKNEIRRFAGKTQIKGHTMIPLELYFKNGRAKVKVGLAKGKAAPDRREDIKKRDLDRDLRRRFAERQKI